MIINNLAKAYAESGKYELAEEMAREAVRIAEKTQNTHLSQFMANLGTILDLQGILQIIVIHIIATYNPRQNSWDTCCFFLT